VPIVVCLCGQRVEAPNAAALEAAFFAHTDGEHPEIKVSDARREAVGGAIRRSGGWDGERLDLPSDIELRTLTPELKDDYLAFFDADAFPDNPVWAACYCLAYCVVTPPGEIYDDRSAAQNRAERAAMIERGEASGVLAYVGPRVIGWCHAAPRTSLPALDETPEFAFEGNDRDRTAAIVCFVIAPAYRGQGLSRRLLDGACDAMRERGMRWLEAYPPLSPGTAASSYHGRLSMYEAAGFERLRDVGRFAIMRKAL
jgi:GNAT superfamily N-acetyltransferase